MTELLPVIDATVPRLPSLEIDGPLAAAWLEEFLRDELVLRRGIRNAVVGLSGGVDSAVTAFLCARGSAPSTPTPSACRTGPRAPTVWPTRSA